MYEENLSDHIDQNTSEFDWSGRLAKEQWNNPSAYHLWLIAVAASRRNPRIRAPFPIKAHRRNCFNSLLAVSSFFVHCGVENIHVNIIFWKALVLVARALHALTPLAIWLCQSSVGDQK